MSSRALSAPPRASKLKRILRVMATKQYHYAPAPRREPVWVGKKRPSFPGAKPANDVLKYLHAQSFPARFAKLMRRAI